MKQVVQYVNNGQLKVEEVPPPALRRGGVLVASRYSLVSTGTERMVVDMAKKSLVGKALERPDLVKQVWRKVKTEGLLTTVQKVKTRMDAPIALGYSCAGVVIAVAEDVDEFAPGDRVACAGLNFASHAEVCYVPKNLCVKMPSSVEFDEAAYVTLGAIAMQGVRIAEVTLGESVVVIGLGLLGQLALQILKAAGCSVLGIDLDPAKVELAMKLGADAAVVRSDDPESAAMALSRGRGMDAAVITAATSSNDPVELAAELMRDKGRVVLVGAVGMNFTRKPYYDKELEIRLSRSYGPGRYDLTYEVEGIDYPIGYVRWTERRNMESFLDLVARRAVKVRDLTTHTFDIADAKQAYDMISGSEGQFLGILLKYPVEQLQQPSTIQLKPLPPEKTSKVKINMIGVGAFGQGVILPNLAKIENAELRCVVTRNGIEAHRTGTRFGAKSVGSSAEEAIFDAVADAVIIATRHDQHVPLAVKTLESGKHVFVEKPLAVTPEQLDEVIAAYKASPCELVVDFNRRLSPLTNKLMEVLKDRTRPLVMTYRVNAGFIPRDHWVHHPQQGGGRIIGEVCHFVDLLQYICKGRPVEVRAFGTCGSDGSIVNHDNVVISLKFSDGSVGAITYSGDGDTRLPKERLEVFGDGISCVIDDFKSGTFLYRGKAENTQLKAQDKGHAAMLRAFVDMAAGKASSPVPFDEAVAATRATFAIHESLGLGVGISL
jgi:predicted dehydrogenase/threonine dehydrogenase-like Zn-dependent dehydrogenase